VVNDQVNAGPHLVGRLKALDMTSATADVDCDTRKSEPVKDLRRKRELLAPSIDG
jgi:hypothetical protein